MFHESKADESKETYWEEKAYLKIFGAFSDLYYNQNSK